MLPAHSSLPFNKKQLTKNKEEVKWKKKQNKRCAHTYNNNKTQQQKKGYLLLMRSGRALGERVEAKTAAASQPCSLGEGEGKERREEHRSQRKEWKRKRKGRDTRG